MFASHLRKFAAILLGILSLSLAAQDAGGRGITDSVVTTIIGGNNGNGATDATTMPLTSLQGGITRDSAGNIYYTDVNRIVKQTGAAVSILAGALASGTAAENVKAVNARFAGPTLLATDPSNNIYVLDSSNNRIRKIDGNLNITTVVGNGNSTVLIEDIGRIATDASLPQGIVGIAVNAAGDIFFASNFTQCIYSVPAATKKLTLIAGDGNFAPAKSGVVALANPIGGSPTGLALLSDGTLIYGSSDGAIRNIKNDGTNVVIAGVIDATPGATLNDVLSQDALYPDNGTLDALQSISATVTLAQVGGINPGPLAVDGATIFFIDFTENRIRSFTVGGKIQTVFGEVSEGGQTTGGGFRGQGVPAAPSTPRLGVVVTAGPNAIIDSATGGDDVIDFGSRPNRIFAGPNNTSDTTATGDDVQVVPAATAATDDQTPRNDDPRFNVSNGNLVAAGGVVTFVDDNNQVIRQFTVGGNVNTIAGTTDPIRLSNGVATNRHPKISTNNPIPALGAPIFSPSQVARDATGNLFFDANDIQTNHNIWKFDAAAKTIAVVAGRVITNGYPSNPGDGGPAATAKLNGLGSQISVLADGTLLFADLDTTFFTTSHTIRAIGPTGTLSTIAGIPNLGIFGGVAPDVDQTIVKADGTLVNPTPRLGLKPTDVSLFFPFAVIGTSAQDFIVGDTFNNRLLVVTANAITVDAFVTQPEFLTALSSTVVVASTPGGFLTRVDYTNPAAIATVTAATGLGTVRGMVAGNIGGTQVLFVLDNAGTQIDVRDATTLAQFYTVAPLTAVLPAGNLRGMSSDGTNLIIAQGAQLRTVALSLFTAGTSAPVIAGNQFPAIAGQFANVNVNGFNLQTNFQFNNFVPMGLLGTDIIVGDDGAQQFRRITLGTTPPASTFTVYGGTGIERIGGADGGPATAANVIGTVEGIAVDSTGAFYFTDVNERTVRKVAGGTLSLFAGIPGQAGSNQPNNVNALAAEFSSSLGGLAVNAANEVAIADTGNNIVRKVKTDGTIATIAGLDESLAGAGGEAGDPLFARLNSPHNVAFDANGDLFISENISLGSRVHVLSTKNIITVIGGGGGDSLDYNPLDAFEADLLATGMALDAAGKVYLSVSNTTGRISMGLAQTVVGDPVVSGYNGDGLAGTQTLLETPKGLAFDATLGLIICDTGNDRIRAVTNLAEATNNPPTAVIVTTPDRLGQAPLKVHFDASKSVDADGDIVVFEWDFGDGTKGFGETVDHIYTATGSYTVTLTVTDTAGNTSTTKTVVFAATPLVGSSTSGKGAFKVAFGPKAVKPSDAFALAMKNVNGLTNQVGKPAKIIIGSFSIDAVVGGKGIKTTSKTTKLTIDTVKKTITLSIKGVKLASALAELGVVNENTVAPGKSVLIPVIVNVNNGALVVGDKFLFFYKAKFNSGASGKFAQ